MLKKKIDTGFKLLLKIPQIIVKANESQHRAIFEKKIEKLSNDQKYKLDQLVYYRIKNLFSLSSQNIAKKHYLPFDTYDVKISFSDRRMTQEKYKELSMIKETFSKCKSDQQRILVEYKLGHAVDGFETEDIRECYRDGYDHILVRPFDVVDEGEYIDAMKLQEEPINDLDSLFKIIRTYPELITEADIHTITKKYNSVYPVWDPQDEPEQSTIALSN